MEISAEPTSTRPSQKNKRWWSFLVILGVYSISRIVLISYPPNINQSLSLNRAHSHQEPMSETVSNQSKPLPPSSSVGQSALFNKPSLDDFQPMHVPTPEEVRATKQIAASQSSTPFGNCLNAVNSEWVLSKLMRKLDTSHNGLYDPEFSTTDPRWWDQLTEGLDSSYWEMYSEATNLEMALKIRQQALRLQESHQHLSNSGLAGTIILIVVAILDPVTLIIALVIATAVRNRT